MRNSAVVAGLAFADLALVFVGLAAVFVATVDPAVAFVADLSAIDFADSGSVYFGSADSAAVAGLFVVAVGLRCDGTGPDLSGTAKHAGIASL